MILILTSSLDVTTDLIIPYLTSRDIFRFNIDLWKDYSWRITSDGYELSDPIGRVCNEANVGAVYERKLFFNPVFIDTPAGGNEESWCRSEVEQIWANIKDAAYGDNKLALVHPSTQGVWKKMRQMREAKKYFVVPQWEMSHKIMPELEGSVVCKTNAASPAGQGSMLMVNRVCTKDLDMSYPWFLQNEVIDAISDVTVAYIKGKIFAFALPRSSNHSVDCRQTTYHNEANWTFCQLPQEDEDKIRQYMQQTGYDFARLDFLQTAQGLVFLEMNTNGQYAWLDMRDEYGLLSAIADEIIRVHDNHIRQIS